MTQAAGVGEVTCLVAGVGVPDEFFDATESSRGFGPYLLLLEGEGRYRRHGKTLELFDCDARVLITRVLEKCLKLWTQW